MKQLFFLLLVSIFILSCKSNKKNTNNDTTAIDTKDSAAVALIKEFKPIINGSWVKADYIDKIAKTKSPAEAADLAQGLTAFIINTSIIKGDSIIADAGWENHEGSDLVLKFVAGKTPKTIKLGDYDMDYTITKSDTTLTLTYTGTEKLKQKVVRYIHASNTITKNLGEGMDFMINKNVFAGNYLAIDSTGKTNKVTLTVNGIINGLADYKTYYIFNDLNNGPMTNLDGIAFDLYSKHQSTYSFKFKGDTLGIYNTLANADSTEEVFGKLKYKLIRQK